MKSVSASSFKPSRGSAAKLRIAASEAGVALVTFVALTLAVAGGAQAAEPVPAKPGPGTRIAAPAGASEADRGAAEKFWDQIPPDARGDVTNMTYPLEPGPESRKLDEVEKRRREMRARPTDTELMGVQRTINDRFGYQLGEIDRALGLDATESSGNYPSFTLGVEAIRKLYKERVYGQALIETNDLLRFYPRSAQLLMMKGTLLRKLNQLDLALMAYSRAFEYEPSEELKRQIKSLENRIATRESLRGPAKGVVIPGDAPEIRNAPVATPPSPEVK